MCTIRGSDEGTHGVDTIFFTQLGAVMFSILLTRGGKGFPAVMRESAGKVGVGILNVTSIPTGVQGSGFQVGVVEGSTTIPDGLPDGATSSHNTVGHMVNLGLCYTGLDCTERHLSTLSL